MAYATVAQLRARLGIADGGEDQRLAEVLDRASTEIDDICGQDFTVAATATARVFAPSCDGVTVLLGERDTIGAITGLAIAEDTAGDGTYTSPVPIADVITLPHNAWAKGWPVTSIRRLVGTWATSSTGRPPVQITARWGWPATPIPVTEASLILAAELWKLKDAPLGVAGFGEFGVVRVRDNAAVMSRVARYRRGGAVLGVG